ncbi:MAG: hypothetical protein JWM28_4295 [Chitinophagaceae bacterium]|nr:hypothetical protein [Chitinophagaceae bacterium]
MINEAEIIIQRIEQLFIVYGWISGCSELLTVHFFAFSASLRPLREILWNCNHDLLYSNLLTASSPITALTGRG